MPFTQQEIGHISIELDRMQQILIDIYNNQNHLDIKHREMIRKYIIENQLPRRPDTIPECVKEFVTSTTSQTDIRNQLRAYNKKEYPLRDTIAQTLTNLYQDDRFLDDNNWIPENLYAIANEIAGNLFTQQQMDDYKPHTYGNPLKLHVILLIKTGAQNLQTKLAHGLNVFYNEVDTLCNQDQNNTCRYNNIWQYAQTFSEYPVKIRNVGTPLSANFLKEIGFIYFIKSDVHVIQEFPALIARVRQHILPNQQSQQQEYKEKKLFLRMLELAEQLGMTPYKLDKILYLYGYCKGLGLVIE